MGLIRTVTDDDSRVYRTIPLSMFVTVTVALLSAVGAQQTWLMAAAHERSAITSLIKAQIATEDKPVASDIDKLRADVDNLQAEVAIVHANQRSNEQTISINSGRLEVLMRDYESRHGRSR
jgi:hypothetical protein